MKTRLIVSLLAATLIFSGCGGGGGGAIGASAPAPIFITDSLDDHVHVWVTIVKVVLHGGGTAVTVFEPSGGMTVDLRSLHDSFGERFKFLATAREGIFDDITFTLDKDLVLFEAGNPTGLDRVFAGNDGTNVDLVLVFPQPRSIGPDSPMVVDFDLANWDDNGTFVSGAPFLAESSGALLEDDGRHQRDDIEGVISNLSGPEGNQTFTLVREEDDVLIRTTSETVFLDIEALANGMHVEVEGFFSVEANAFIAETIEPAEKGDVPEVLGRVTMITSPDGTLDVVIEAVEHFMPEFNVVHIVTTPKTVFINMHGDDVSAAAFFETLPLNALLEAMGTYEPGTNTLTADRVGYEDIDDGG